MFLESNPEGAFSFRRYKEPTRPVDPEFITNTPLNELLLQAALEHDHFKKLPRELRTLEASF